MKKDTTTTPTTKPELKQPELEGIPPAPQKQNEKTVDIEVILNRYINAKLSGHETDEAVYKSIEVIERGLKALYKKGYKVNIFQQIIK